MLPVDPKREGSGGCRTGAKARSTWTMEPAREGGECQVKKVEEEEEEEEGGTEGRRGKGPGETWAHVVYFSFGRRGSGSFAVVSDSVLNEARVGFLSHPKTMLPARCPHGPSCLRFQARGSARRSASSPSPRFLSGSPSPPLRAFTGFLHQISYTHDLRTRPGRFFYLRALAPTVILRERPRRERCKKDDGQHP